MRTIDIHERLRNSECAVAVRFTVDKMARVSEGALARICRKLLYYRVRSAGNRRADSSTQGGARRSMAACSTLALELIECSPFRRTGSNSLDGFA